jgi:hypothetical protein
MSGFVYISEPRFPKKFEPPHAGCYSYTVTETAAIEIMIEHLKGLFPKTCPNCRRNFATLRDFYLNTTPVGNPISYDLEAGDPRPQHPRGAVAISNCDCGTPIALKSDGMPLFRLWSLLLWAKAETKRRKITETQLLTELRVKVRKKVVAETPI